MLHHRFRELIEAATPVPAAANMCGGGSFVPCPMFPAFAAARQAAIQDIYRIAAERTRSQLAPVRRSAYSAEFSRN